jgi:Tol biopolymer transport system component/predicted Ser/Thr protein kinase
MARAGPPDRSPPEVTVNDLAGQTISHYRILEMVGQGGMGVVYKAEDLTLTREVALKFLPHGLEPQEPERARFLQEARAAAILNHPNICTVYEIAEADGQQFIVMELVEGKTLRELLPLKKMQDAITYAIQIAEALEEAHSKGIVHRDIKAENIMVNTKNQVKVMDFGLAKLKGTLKLTKTSSTIGTLAYMAPEQIQGEEVDARSDIFSFGIVLYEMLTGHLPFRGEHEAAMVYSIVNEEPEPLQHYVPDAPSELLHILDRALEKDREERYQTVHEMLIDLRRLRKDSTRVSRQAHYETPVMGASAPVPEEKAGRAGRKRLWVGVAGLVVLAGAAVCLLLLLPRGAKLNPAMSFRTLEIPFAQVQFPSLSRDGNWIAFAACDARGEWAIYFMNIAKRDPRRLTSDNLREVGYAEISPDGSEVLYDYTPQGMLAGIYVVSSLGGQGRKLVEPGDGGRWRPDGQLIGYIRLGAPYRPSQSGKREFWTVRPDGKGNRLEFVDSVSQVLGNYCFDWSPDGKSVAWLRTFPGYEEIIIRDLESGKERQLTSSRKLITELAWASNDQILFTSSRGGNTNIWTIPAKGGEAVQVTKGSGPDLSVRVSGDAKRLLFLEQRSIAHLWTVDIDGRNARELTFEDQSLDRPSFSPDKKQICYEMYSADLLRPGGHIYTIRSDGSDRTQVSAGEGNHYVSSWSPDGKYFIYGSRQVDETLDSSRLFLFDASNLGTPRLTYRGALAFWIDEERFLAGLGIVSMRAFIYSVHDNRPLRVLQDSTLEFPLHDGKNVLVWDARRGREGWWMTATEAGPAAERRQILSGEHVFSAWPSSSLRYLLWMKGNGEAWRISLADGKQLRLPGIVDGLNPATWAFQLSYDDTRIVFAKRRYDARLVLIENLFK